MQIPQNPADFQSVHATATQKCPPIARDLSHNGRSPLVNALVFLWRYSAPSLCPCPAPALALSLPCPTPALPCPTPALPLPCWQVAATTRGLNAWRQPDSRTPANTRITMQTASTYQNMGDRPRTKMLLGARCLSAILNRHTCQRLSLDLRRRQSHLPPRPPEATLLQPGNCFWQLQVAHS